MEQDLNQAFIEENNTTLSLNAAHENQNQNATMEIPNISMVEQEASELNLTPIPPNGNEAQHFLDMLDNIEPIEPVGNNGPHDLSMGGKRKKQGGGKRTMRARLTKRTRYTKRIRLTRRTRRITKRH